MRGPGALVVTCAELRPALEEVLAKRLGIDHPNAVRREHHAHAANAAPSTLYGYATLYAARNGDTRIMHGRAPVYAIVLGPARAVVRHSLHGGLLARFTGDRFLAPTRAPRELAAAIRLRHAGVLTPEVLAYATYPAGPALRRADIVTREVRGHDLAWALGSARTVAERGAAIAATAELLAALVRAGARHPDLNLKNVLVSPAAGPAAASAYVLDIDRVVFGRAGDAGIAAANVQRVRNSLRKWRARGRIQISDDELRALSGAA